MSQILIQLAVDIKKDADKLFESERKKRTEAFERAFRLNAEQAKLKTKKPSYWEWLTK